MAENQELKEVAAQAAQRQQDQREQQPVAGSVDETAKLQARLQQLQLENDTLRQQLRLSESLRRKGRKALTDLKQVGWPGRVAWQCLGVAILGSLNSTAGNWSAGDAHQWAPEHTARVGLDLLCLSSAIAARCPQPGSCCLPWHRSLRR